jgi:hypothetical protein
MEELESTSATAAFGLWRVRWVRTLSDRTATTFAPTELKVPTTAAQSRLVGVLIESGRSNRLFEACSTAGARARIFASRKEMSP